ncbi:homoserine O-acetyltransferase [Oscillatoria sp. FACHB-1406]|uniref:homoserine O-acetyltransferase MetX n=1 Tax=Oscillatoria sp. FACHB-1406 TaxID=2692846 RepID=UPI001684C505|nr:homoserine O-acetyltransferase [Oscillatoria sp. FACHB-1406]MBD2580071.1 homoserine O-acetyltransferase [Oscillatoria sp. FACHB-1406]
MSIQAFISPQTQFYRLPEPYLLESGFDLPQVDVAYCTWGTLNADRSNAVLVCHALTGWAQADAWWGHLFGPGKALDPTRDFIVCSNVLGSCYGTTGPTSLNPATGRAYAADFPEITIRDMVRLQARLLDALGIDRLQLAIGGSLGGMQVLEWAMMFPERVGAIAAIAVSGRHSAWCIGLSETQRQAIYLDPLWQDGYYDPESPPAAGLAAARAIAMLTYRSWANFEERFGRQHANNNPNAPFTVTEYLQHHGRKIVDRFDANTYVTLTKAMDTYDLSRDRGDYPAVLEKIAQPTLIVGIESDVLYPPIEQQQLVEAIPNAKLAWLPSPHGHDGFLLDRDILDRFVVDFRAAHCANCEMSYK